MEIAKKYGILIGKFFGFFLIGSLVLSVFEYFLLNSKTVHIIGFIYLIIIFFFLNFFEAKKSTARGFITGLKTGGILLALLLVINLIIFQSQFKFLRLIYYLILLFVSLFGAIVGINSKNNQNS